jgi:hypothetical protein
MALNRLKSSSRLTRSGACTNPESQVARYAKFCRVAPNVCGYPVWNWRIRLLEFLGGSYIFGKFVQP